MAALGRTVRIRFLDGQERTFPHVRVDQDVAGWLFLTRIQASPILSGVPAPIAGRAAAPEARRLASIR